MNEDVCRILTDVLGLDPATTTLAENTALLGELPEFDSMAVVSVLTALEDHYGIMIEDDEVDATIFETVGTLSAFVAQKVDG
ncbi:MAG: phosphopantetheine-binding protein [Gammaproteobacteria bacterium]